jgi:hypothetical protein
MYAALMASGATLEDYQNCERIALANGLATKRGECLYPTPKFVQALALAKISANDCARA